MHAKKPKFGPKTMKRFEISKKLYAEGLPGYIVVSRGGMAKSKFHEVIGHLNAQQTAT